MLNVLSKNRSDNIRTTKSAIATDLISVLIFVVIILLLIPLWFSVQFGIGFLFLLLGFIFYLAKMVAVPLQQSEMFADILTTKELNDPSIELRKSDIQPTRALDLIIKKYIIINTNDLEDPDQRWIPLLHHEHAHIQNKDTLFFHFAGIMGSMILANFIAMSIIPLLIFLQDELEITKENIQNTDLAFVVPLVLLIPTAILVFWIRRSLYKREFAADVYSHRINAKRFVEWVSRASRREKLPNISLMSKIISRISFSLTHPTFSQRLSNIEHKGSVSLFSLTADIFMSILLLSLSIVLSIIYYEAYLESAALPIPNWLGYTHVSLMLALPILVSANLSFTFKEAIDSSAFTGALVCSSIFMSLCVFLFFWAAEALKILGRMNQTDNVLEEPAIIFLVLGSYCFVTISLNLVLKLFKNYDNYNLLIHAFIGIISFVGSGYIPQAIFYIIPGSLVFFQSF